MAYKSRNATVIIVQWVKFLGPHITSKSLNTPGTSGHCSIHMINELWTANDPLSEVFHVVTLSSDMFVNPSIPAKGITQSRDKGRTLSGKVNCSLPFSKHLGSSQVSHNLI